MSINVKFSTAIRKAKLRSRLTFLVLSVCLQKFGVKTQHRLACTYTEFLNSCKPAFILLKIVNSVTYFSISMQSFPLDENFLFKIVHKASCLCNQLKTRGNDLPLSAGYHFIKFNQMFYLHTSILNKIQFYYFKPIIFSRIE